MVVPPVEAPVPDASFLTTTPEQTGQLYTAQRPLVAAKHQQPPALGAGLSWVGQRIAVAQWQEKQS